ncbi:MAG: hypothetical protein LUE21_07635, partial [Oscillospiraceae bacterium]|nr:hypothetical protein [Oscillospiraceae bacterium]
ELKVYDIPHFASYAGEPTKELAIKREEYEFIKSSQRVKLPIILDNLDSVYLMVHLGNGITVAPMNKKVKASGLKSVQLDRTITLCMTRLLENDFGNTADLMETIEARANREGAEQS